jgi:hypothetical protein
LSTVAWTPYSTVRPMMSGTFPGWVPDEEQERVTSYTLYEQMYWSHPTTFRLQARGTENNPIYIPSARVIVDTTARYVAKGLGVAYNPTNDPSLTANEQDRINAQFAFSSLFKREKFFSGFHANKFYGIMKGDYVFHVIADPARADGRRISIVSVDPGSYFPVLADPNDPESLQGVILADLVAIGDDEFVRRQLYRRELNADGTYTIFTSLAYFKPEAEAWYNLEGEPENVPAETTDETPLDPQIQAIPVYAIRNNPTPGRMFGSSECRGLERLFAAVNQGISDEELALALEGLGMYATEGGPPRDEDGNILPAWPLGPGRVVETDADANFRRIAGISSVTPYRDHLGFLIEQMRDATGANEAATGKVDVQVAESGIALALRLAPLLSRIDVYDLHVTDVIANLYYDLATYWFPVYESNSFVTAMVEPTLGDKLPLNRKQRFDELVQMHQLGVITTEYFLTEVQKLGYELPDTPEAMATAALAEKEARAAAEDPFAARAGGEVATAGAAT